MPTFKIRSTETFIQINTQNQIVLRWNTIYMGNVSIILQIERRYQTGEHMTISSTKVT